MEVIPVLKLVVAPIEKMWKIMLYESQNVSICNVLFKKTDWARQTFWPVKFSPPNFFLKSYLSYGKKLASIKKCPLWPPRGTWGGYKGVRPPKTEKSSF